MGIYQRFFGAVSISAPTIYDTYGLFSIPVGNIDAWASAQQKRNWTVWIDSGVALATGPVRGIKYDIAARASSESAADHWIAAHITDHADSNYVLYHGMKPSMTFREDQNVYFTKDDGYKSRLVTYP